MTYPSDVGVGSPVPEKGARFSAYVSPMNDTKQSLTKWTVTIKHDASNWSGAITSDAPTHELQTPDLGGSFTAEVWGSGPNMPWQPLTSQTGTGQFDCGSTCIAMVGIVAWPFGSSANFWINVLCPIQI